jgi:hypothetical protein
VTRQSALVGFHPAPQRDAHLPPKFCTRPTAMHLFQLLHWHVDGQDLLLKDMLVGIMSFIHLEEIIH